ncbi:dimethyl sulfoxide reductase anchor subunit family protein [Ostreiculturibacter nitratireducens]|uniref:dimethyl sulfoxide reductase anchor subunit family protein n=1 Tax=Ostreiculturibacter nitratireducens TaxID=3075226 RepID=UPI0031B61501
MHPAPSLILFTTLSGLGLGLLACLGLGFAHPEGIAAFFAYGAGYALTGGGLVAAAFHLGNPQRALRAFTQWRTSWLSREAWASSITLLVFAPVALAALFGGRVPVLGFLGAVLAILTVIATAMIYAQLRTVPRWHHWTTPATFLGFALTGGAILAAPPALSAILCLVLAALIAFGHRIGDGRFAGSGTTLATATGLGPRIRAFEPPHTGSNYLTREMIHQVGRKHAQKLRRIAVAASGLLPALVLLVLPYHWVTVLLAIALHFTGALAQRWLFFAEAEHVVGLYYGRR